MLKTAKYVYDAFISYSHVDKTWVQERLAPRLEQAGLRICIDERDFGLGKTIVGEMARAVKESCFTLAILSPAYLTSNFTELERVMARHLGLEKSQRRLLCVMYQTCSPSLDVRAHLWLDMTDNTSFETKVSRLISELQQSTDL